VFVIALASAVEADTEGGVTAKAGVALEELIRRLDSGTIKLIDVREPNEIEETGSIPTSVNIPRITSVYLFALGDLTVVSAAKFHFWQPFYRVYCDKMK